MAVLRQRLATKLESPYVLDKQILLSHPLDALPVHVHLQHQAVLSLLHAPHTARALLSDQVFRTYLFKMFNLPLIRTQECNYTTRTATHTCGHQSDAFGHHAQSCCCGPRTVRHNRLRDKWASLCREAGWYVTTEQYAPCPPTAPPAGTRVDVMVVTRQARKLLQTETTKYSEYGLQPTYIVLPDGSTMRPLVHHTTGYMEGQTLRFAHELASELATLSVAAEDGVWSIQASEWRLRVFAVLGIEFQMADWALLTASAPTL
eukprot:839834-Amphidinium_carterae.1